MHKTEAEILGVSHAEIGAYLLSLWGEPDSTVEAVLQHHQPSRVDSPKVNALTAVHIANALHHRDRYDDINQWKSNELDMNYLRNIQLADMVDELAQGCTVEAQA